MRPTPGCRGRRRCRAGCAWSGRPTGRWRPAARRRAAPQPGLAQGQAGDPGDPVGDGPVGADRGTEVVAVVDHLVEGEDGGDDPAVELGDGDARRHVVGPEAGVGAGPVAPGASRRGRLDDGDVEGGQPGDIPPLAVLAAPGARGPGPGGRPAGGEDGGDEGTGAVAAESGDDGLAGLVAERIAPQGEDPAPSGFDGVAQVVDELRVAGDQVGPVEDDADDRAGARRVRGAPDTVVGDREGWVEPHPSSRTVSATKRRRCSKLAGPPWTR